MVWGISALTLLDPYSMFGRFMTFFAKPVVIVLNNLLADLLGEFDVYTISNIPVTGFKLAAYSIPAAFFVLVGTLSLTKGRLYCNMICPVGTLLGLLSKISIYRIKFDESACTRCGRCAVSCKSSCIDFLSHNVDVTRCVDCFNCISICQDKALSYSAINLKKKEHQTDESKRTVIVSSVFLLFGLTYRSYGQEKAAPKPKKESTVRENKNFPGCSSRSWFNSRSEYMVHCLFSLYKCMPERRFDTCNITVWFSRVYAAGYELSQEFLYI